MGRIAASLMTILGKSRDTHWDRIRHHVAPLGWTGVARDTSYSDRVIQEWYGAVEPLFVTALISCLPIRQHDRLSAHKSCGRIQRNLLI